MRTRMASTAALFLLRLALAAIIVLGCAVLLRAGGPKTVAGTAYFDPTVTGQPVIWRQGLINYYTDQGDLSAIWPNASANSLVASAFAVWTSVSTAAITATNAGQLSEDVNGGNVYVNADGSIAMPPDIQPTATNKPVGVVYDYDGAVTNALMGQGAGDSSQCFSNAVFGGADNFASNATFLHALIVINGQCALQSSQHDDLEYRLVRVIGGVLGLGWSQLNVNVQTGSPYPTSDDYAGFPVMHFIDPTICVPINRCYPYQLPYQLSMDDMAAISRLYPVNDENKAILRSKQVFSSSTARIHGSVYFTDAHGIQASPMQGVNVVARWIDPATGKPSRRYAASSVSGFLFRGNSGNPITGFNNAIGDPFADWGSTDESAEGFFDLAGLQPPGSGAQYQLTIESVDPGWSAGVGPYSPDQVAPSGSAQPITVTVTPGGDVEQNILMTGSAQPLPEAPSSWAIPASLPGGGDWTSSLNDYGDVAYFLLQAQANRTLSVAVTALDEASRATDRKARPAIGMWNASDPPGTPPPAFASPFNQLIFGVTRLDAAINTSANFLIGISDVRGNGRPDYRYHARVLYADSVSTSRVSVNGGTVSVQGTGFAPGLTSSIGPTGVKQLAVSSGQMILVAPAHSDGPQDITIADPVSGGSSVMTGALTYGAAASDNIVLLYGLNPATPVGAKATNPVTVRVLAADGVTPVSGATVGWSGNNGVQLSACSSASACSVITDQSGYSATWLTPGAPGVATITATLAPGVYSPAKSVNATLYGIESSSDIGVSTPYVWISQGSTVDVPLTARALSNGTPRNNIQINFAIMGGAGSLSAGSAQTNSSGYATVTLSISQISALVMVSACVAPAGTPCGVFYVNPVALAQQNLQQVSGAGQVSTGGSFLPIVVRVTDSASPPHAVVAAPVTFLSTVLRPGGTRAGTGAGETNPGNPAMPVILKVTQSAATTDSDGLASITPSSAGFDAPVDVDVAVSAGTSAFLDNLLEVLPAPSSADVSSAVTSAPVSLHLIRTPQSPQGTRRSTGKLCGPL